MKHQWVSPGDIRVFRVCSQCGYQILVSRDVDPVAAIAVEDCPGRGDRRLLSNEVGERFLDCIKSIQAVHDAFLREGAPSGAQARSYTLFDAVRTCLTAAAVFINRSGEVAFTDAELRETLHMLVEKAVDDYQANMRLHLPRGD